jgi:hypothetical protein
VVTVADGGFVEGDVIAVGPDGVPVGQTASGQRQPPRLLLAINPILAMASLVGQAIDESPGDQMSGLPGGVPVFGDALEFLRVGNAAGQPRVFDMQGRAIVAEPTDDGPPLWRLSLAAYGGGAGLLFVATVWMVARAIGPRWRPRWPWRRPGQIGTRRSVAIRGG